MKLCKDCKNYEASDMGAPYDKCTKRVEDTSTRALVRGGEHTLYAYCETMRGAFYCGTGAVWFEPKEKL